MQSLTTIYRRSNQSPIMTHTTGADEGRDIYFEKASTSSNAQELRRQIEEPFTDTSSIYSDNETGDEMERSLLAVSNTYSRNIQHEPNPALPYLRIISDLRETMYPVRPKMGSYNGDMTRWKSIPSKSMPDLVASNTLQRTQWARSDSTTNNDFTSTFAARQGSSRPIMYTEPQSQSNGKLKAIRFQDTLDGLSTPSRDWSRAEVSQPLWVGGFSEMPANGPRRSRSALSLRLPGRVRHDNPSPSRSAVINERLEDVPVGEPAPFTSRDELQMFHPLTDVPVRKGWVRKVVRTFAARGQQNNL